MGEIVPYPAHQGPGIARDEFLESPLNVYPLICGVDCGKFEFLAKDLGW
jgi:hypothetical protein